MFEDLIPELQEPARALVEAAGSAGLQPRVTSTRRSATQQARLYRRFLAGQAGFPVAPPGTSAHEFGWAFDMVTSPMEALADVGYTWQTWGGVWGPGDAVHFEYPGFVPPTEGDQRNGAQGGAFTPNLYDKILNFATGFIPVFGTIQLAAFAVSLLVPSISKSEAYDMLQNPLLHLESWAAVQKQWLA
jgi:D-alanyl-D-alanine carboxypeptidase-like protein